MNISELRDSEKMLLWLLFLKDVLDTTDKKDRKVIQSALATIPESVNLEFKEITAAVEQIDEGKSSFERLHTLVLIALRTLNCSSPSSSEEGKTRIPTPLSFRSKHPFSKKG